MSTKNTKEKKIVCYKVDDDCDTPVLYDDLDMAIQTVKDLLDGIDFGYAIKIIKVEMTQEEFDNLPEL